MQTIEGGCLCGAVRYAVSAEPILTRACGCRVCQYFASGNATINVVFPKDAVTTTGELKDYVSTADSGNRMHRRFCPAAARRCSANPKPGRTCSSFARGRWTTRRSRKRAA